MYFLLNMGISNVMLVFGGNILQQGIIGNETIAGSNEQRQRSTLTGDIPLNPGWFMTGSL